VGRIEVVEFDRVVKGPNELVGMLVGEDVMDVGRDVMDEELEAADPAGIGVRVTATHPAGPVKKMNSMVWSKRQKVAAPPVKLPFVHENGDGEKMESMDPPGDAAKAWKLVPGLVVKAPSVSKRLPPVIKKVSADEASVVTTPPAPMKVAA